MKLKRAYLLFIFTLYIFTLINCTTVASETVVGKSTATPVLPTSTPLPTEIPSLTPIPLFSLDGLRMAYIIDGNLYLQDSGKQQVQLTNSGEDYSPIFSSDGEKIVFFRGVLPHTVYSINADGSQEQELVSGSLLNKLNLGYSESTELRSLSFVPGTHQLLVNTHELDPRTVSVQDIYYSAAKPNQDLLLVDTDTAEIKMLLGLGKGGMFRVSPDGNLVGIQATDHIDVIGLDGKVVYQNLATYPSAWLYNRTPDIYWAQDSSKLNVMLPIATENALDSNGPEPRTIWQYSLDGGQAFEIHLNPPPIGDSFNISPDGNWVVYTYYYYEGKTDQTVTPGLYLGNLKNGTSKLVGSVQSYGLPNPYWSPNSVNFIFNDDTSQLFLGNIDGAIILLDRGQFVDWIDEDRYLYSNEVLRIGETGKDKNVTVEKISESIKYISPKYFTVVFLK